MHGIPLAAVALLALPCTWAGTLSRRASTLIPTSTFDSTSALEEYFVYNYPWGGNTHNGGARMDKAHVNIASPGVLTITAQPVKGQPPATHGGKQIPINYLSGAVGAKQHFTVPTGGGFVFSGSFQATTTKGTWPAFWLTAVNGWPPEIDMAEWKGSGKISFNTFNTSSVLSWKDVTYSNPVRNPKIQTICEGHLLTSYSDLKDKFHDIRCELKDVNGKDTQVKFYMDGALQATHVGKGYTGKPFYL
jgi:beta-glucanase (GH16 family)